MASTLSPRQREILELVASGRTSKEIASLLGISESTVNWHLANVFAKLGASNRAEAVARAYAPNGPEHQQRRMSAPVPTLWPRFIAITIAVAIGAALLGGAFVATTLRSGPGSVPTASPADGSDRGPTSTPASGSDGAPTSSPGGGIGGELVGPSGSPNDLPLPVVSAAPLPSVPGVLPTPPLPSLPVTVPPLPTPSLPVPPLPTPSLPVPPLPSPSVPPLIPTPSLPIP